MLALDTIACLLGQIKEKLATYFAAGGAGGVGPEGPQGEPGQDGNTIIIGSDDPGVLDGVDGDGYFRFSPGLLDFYGPKSGGSWGSGMSLIGPQGDTGPIGPDGPTGPTGPTGSTGATGADGATWRNGSGAPSNGL